MKKIALLAVVGLALSGCSTLYGPTTPIHEGALIGSIAGGVVGGVATGSVAGVAVGAGIGAAAGAAVAALAH